MSRIIDIAEAMKARLEAQASLAGVDVVVDAQKDLTAILAKAVAKAKGAAITILFEGFAVPDTNTSGPQILSRYAVRTWSRPVLQQGNTEATAILTAAIQALHHWIPEGLHSFGEMTVTGGDFIPDNKWLIYEVSAEVTLKL